MKKLLNTLCVQLLGSHLRQVDETVVVERERTFSAVRF